MMNILYITYDGLLEPLGQSQVLAYQEKLSVDYKIHILSFEKAHDWNDEAKRTALAERLLTAGIHWHPRRYHKSPSALATAYDILVGTFSALWLVLRNRIGIVHSRSYVPSVMALVVKRLTGAKFIFDMRGFWADERVDGGLWPRDGYLYRSAKWFEKRFLLSADYVVSLTHAAVNEMQTFSYLQNKFPFISTIPTCTDLDRFVPGKPINGPFILGYVGSAGVWYLFDAVLESFKQLQSIKPDSMLMILNRQDHKYILERLSSASISMDSVSLVAADFSEVPKLMQKMNAGIFFYKPSYSRYACAPTKLGEFLASGKPCMANAGGGDMAEIFCNEQCGVIVDSFDSSSLSNGMHQLLALCAKPDIQERCVRVARSYFSLDQGVTNYREIYRKLESMH